jgi:hypothetical protein
MHTCGFTCWKYNVKGGKPVCRFGFPWQTTIEQTDVELRCDVDRKGRKRNRALPPRNNAHINTCFQVPLLQCAHGGNSDCQYIDNPNGAAEYSASYAGKAEAPEQVKLRNIFVKKLCRMQIDNPILSDRQHLRAVAESVIASQQVGTVQACYTLLG